VNVNTDTRKNRAGMTRDVSATGLLFHSRSAFAIGERVMLTFRTPHKVTSTTGHVVRSAPINSNESPFTHATAVEFDVPHLDLDSQEAASR
jgi:hypothetical protein